MNCKNCGKVVAKSHKFCPNCGTKVVEEEKEDVEIKTETPIVSEPKKTQGLTIAGFVLSLVGICNLSVICSVLGLIFSSIAKAKFNPEINNKKGMATAGFVISIVALVLSLLDITSTYFITI